MLGNITIGQYFPGDSLLHRMDPRTKILATLIYIVVIFFAQTVVSYLFVTAFTVWVIWLSKLPVRLLWNALKPLWIIIVFTLAIHVFTSTGTVLWQWSFIHITKEGLQMGVLMTARLVYLILFSSLLTYTTSPIRLTDGIERLLRPFQRLGVPSHELAMMMTIALRFIPTLLEETDRIMKAQESRGADFTTGSLVKRAKSMVPLLVPLFISAFRRADDLAVAMEARCYRGGEGRTRMKELCYTRLDTVSMSILILVVLIILVMRFYAV